jgi:myo-inositol-1(or 4)-monophosphatase
MDKALRHRVNFARGALRQQIQFFDKQRGEVASEWKADDSRVTFADFVISESLQKDLLRVFPTDQFFSEEGVIADEEIPITSRYSWLLDPIDGTNNYALGMASSAISLALLKLGKPIYGWVYDGGTRELLEGGPGHPLLRNGGRVRRLERDPQAPRIIGLHFPLSAGRSRMLEGLLEGDRIRSLGSASLHLAYVALGRLDGVIDERVREWDIAAAQALLEASELAIHFFGPNPFPMRTFRARGPVLSYAAGPTSFTAEAQNWLG